MRTLVALLFAALAVAPPASAAAGLTVTAGVDPGTATFGDRVVYTVEARADGGRIDPASLQVIADTGAFTALEPAQTTRSDRDGTAVVTVRQSIACLRIECVPRRGPLRTELPPAQARAALRAGGTGTAAASPASVLVSPRVTTATVRARVPAYRRQTGLPATSTPVSPGSLAVLLAGIALALSAAAMLLVVLGLRRRASPADGALQDPLARAVRLLRESAGRPPSDRRRAADLVARAVGERGVSQVADDATHVAWARPEPRPEDAVELAGRAEERA